MPYKLVNLNLWQGGNLLKEALEYLHQAKPDIVCLQEVYNSTDPQLARKYHSLDVLTNDFDTFNFSFAPAFADLREGKEVVQGNAIGSRFPILKQEVVFYDVPYGVREQESPQFYPYTPRNLQVVTLDVEGTEVVVANTQGIWGLDGKDSPRRLEMSRVIVDKVKDFPHLILAGDFNLRPDTQTIKNIELHLVNVFKPDIESGQLKTTFNMVQKDNPGYASAVVDMVFVGKKIEVLAYSCPKVDVSDHLPLEAEFEIIRG